MKLLIYIIIALGLFEMASNLYHLLKGNKESIGISAKRQHQELSLELESHHFFLKSLVMFVFGLLFTISGFGALIKGYGHFFAIVLGLFALYGIAQAFYYKRPYNVWMSLVVYIAPFLVLLFLSNDVHDAENKTVTNSSNKELFVFPFVLGIEPIKRLLVISFKDDPEYEMIEPQYFNDTVFGNGLRILVYILPKLPPSVKQTITLK